ncbi:MAG: hypothetical protein J0H14_04010 [Alphaproteobacteria bacterium]|nr:hypothetical protein [Alphaproteobacteria bacterium]
MKRLHSLVVISLAAMLLFACSGQQGAGPQTVEGMQPVGTVDMREVQAAYIGSGTAGSGTLFFNGRSYPFKVGGLGVGGIGVSTVDAAGDVYNLRNVRDFAGSYAEGRYGFAFGTRSAGDLWLENENHVILHLHAKRTGLMLSLGGDVMVITFDGT